MGVPAFFRWLSRKYPSIVLNANEKQGNGADGETAADGTEPNPNDVEFDNLYLDMNGIIHPCCHPESKPAPANEDEMMLSIFEYIDRLMNIVRPRRLLYMAIDGVAPRAKMNQQRSRRFRAVQDNQQRRDQIDKVRQRLKAEGIPVPPEKPADQHFDSNCITPGTPFMDRLAVCLRYYVYARLNSNPAWKDIQVVLSDANVPGEGEHKIMDYIRRQRASPSHDPNTHHCLCGADADLIMLGLATHEPNFTIIREEFVPNKQSPCALCKKYGHELEDCQGLIETDKDTATEEPFRETNFIFIRLAVLREYLSRELLMDALPFEFDLERAIDDWVFMCFFVGNDFLPHLPSLEIRENAIDRLIRLYKECVYRTNGWLTESGHVHLARVQLILSKLGEVEDEIFRNRQQKDTFFKRKRKRERRQRRAQSADGRAQGGGSAGKWPRSDGGMFSPQAPGGHASRPTHSGADVRRAASQARVDAMGGRGGGNQPDTSDSEPEPADEVRLFEAGWKERYYQSKFEVSSEDRNFRQGVARAYTIGLCWVLKYYYQGVPSWKWFYPFHYAPFASDFVGLADMQVHLEPDTQPFNPMEQLMGVFPAGSKQHLPKPWQPLMTDLDSPILDFYPSDFKVDLNGKKFAWQGVALLPFVEEHRLLAALEPVYPLLTDDEKRRNTLGTDRIFISKSHSCFQFLQGIYDDNSADWLPLAADLCKGMSGDIRVDPLGVQLGGRCPCPIKAALKDIQDNQSVGVQYRDSLFAADFVFSSKRLDGAKTPEATLKPQDWNNRRSGNYEPVIGFSRDRQRGSLGAPGERMVQRAAGVYSRMPPPQHGMDNRDRRRQSPRSNWHSSNGRGRGGQQYGGGGYDRQRDYGFNRVPSGPSTAATRGEQWRNERSGGGQNYASGQHHYQQQQPHMDIYMQQQQQQQQQWYQQQQQQQQYWSPQQQQPPPRQQQQQYGRRSDGGSRPSAADYF